MPTDPPKAVQNDSSFDEVIVRQTSSIYNGCIAFGPPSGYQSVSVPGEEYRFRFAPQPGITVSEQRDSTWQRLSTVLLNEQEVRRFLQLIRPPAKGSDNTQTYSQLQVELRKCSRIVKTYPLSLPYYLRDDADERDLTYLGIYTGSTISLDRVFQQARQASERRLSQVGYASKPRYKTVAYQERRATESRAWENLRALDILRTVPGYSDILKRFNVDVVRLQEDRLGMALVASLTPKRQGVLDTIEWYCPLTRGDGRQLLNTWGPLAQQTEKNRWLTHWKAAQPNREVLARVRTNTVGLVLFDDGRELPSRPVG